MASCAANPCSVMRPPSLYPSPFLLPRKPLSLFPFIVPSIPFNTPRSSYRRESFPLSRAAERKLESSWIHAERGSNDNLGGWLVGESEIEERNAALPKLIIVGIGTSVAILLAAFSYHAVSRRGFKFPTGAPFHILYELLVPSESTIDPVKDADSPLLEPDQFPEAELDVKSNIAFGASTKKEKSVSAVEHKHIAVSVDADSTQLEALLVLKKLKIIESETSANELCTRREYARWLVKANSMLERNPNLRIVPLVSIAGSMVTAFDDVSVDDPDFWCIQALGEAGIVLSKLLVMDSSDNQENLDFFPESFISRFDLLNWKALLEYSFTSELEAKMLRKNVSLLDLSAIIPHASPQLLTDLMAGDKSITRRVFGNIRRLQPHKPVTKAQAAVVLTSGRMSEAINLELSRLEVENLSRSAEMEEIRSELVCRGEIQSLWEEKLNMERNHGFEAENDFRVALSDLEKEKMARDENSASFMKHKAALDYQQQLMFNLRKEVDEMCDRVASVRENFVSEQHSLEKLYIELRDKQDAMIEAKSILEAEKEALIMLRRWVEEEARGTHERANVLEQAAQRWKWKWNDDDDESPPENKYPPQTLQETKEGTLK